jgi:hypothetical protein
MRTLLLLALSSSALAAETLVITPLVHDGDDVVDVRVLTVADELLERTFQRRADPGVLDVSRGLGGCAALDAETVATLTDEVTCAGGEAWERTGPFDDVFGPDLPDLDPVSPVANDGEDGGEHPALDGPPGVRAVSAGVRFDAGFEVTSFDLGACWGSTCGTLGELLDATGDDGSTADTETPRTEEDDALDAAIEDYLRWEPDFSADKAEESFVDTVVDAVETVVDVLFGEDDDRGSDDADATDDAGTPTDDATQRPNPDGDWTEVPAECEEALAERFDPGVVDPIDPAPGDAGGGDMVFLACWGDADEVVETASCRQDLVAYRDPSRGSLCAEQAVDALTVPMLTRNDLVTDPAPDTVHDGGREPVLPETPTLTR